MIDSKLPDIGTNIFTVMSGLAAEHNALNLSQGFPDFPVSPELIDRINYYMKEGQNQYAPMPGVPALRKEIARVAEESYSRKTDADSEVTIYAGATGGLFSTFTALIHPGDEVIMFDPVYDSYDPAIRLSGGVPIHLRMEPPDFQIPWEDVRAAITPKTRVIVINNPHNPTGSVISEQDLDELENIAISNDLIIVADEVYERIIFGGKVHASVLSRPKLRDRSICLYSFGKTFHATGWKIGYSIADPLLTREIRKVHQFVNFAVNTPIQLAISDHLKNAENYTYLGDFFEQKKNKFLQSLDTSPFSALPCFGTYFQMVSYDKTNETDFDLTRRMIVENGIAAIPVSAFYSDGYDAGLLRFCFAKSDDTLAAASTLLKSITL